MMDTNIMSREHSFEQLCENEKELHKELSSLRLAMRDPEVRKQNPMIVKQYNVALKQWGEVYKKVRMHMLGEYKQFEGEGGEGSKLEEESDNGDVSMVSPDLKDGENNELDGYSSDIEARVKRMKMFVSENDPSFLAPGEVKVDYRKWVKYGDQVRKSGGFVIDDFPGFAPRVTICPVDINASEYMYSFVAGLATKALDVYNSDNGMSYKFHKLVRANVQLGVGGLFYVTFEAKNSEAADDTETFEAKIHYGVRRNDVELCRIKYCSDGVV